MKNIKICIKNLMKKNDPCGTSLVVQWLKTLGSIPGQGTRSHMPKLRPGAAKIYTY